MSSVHSLRSVPLQPVRFVNLAAERGKPARERARAAVNYQNGTIKFAPSIRNLAALFHVSATYIQQAKRDAAHDQPVADSNLLTMWQRAGASEREAFLRAVQDSVWSLLERAPVPQPKSLNGHVRIRRSSPYIHASE